MTMELLELRLRSLERRNARLKIVVLLVAMLAVGTNLASVSENLWANQPRPAVQDTIRANRIEVVDTDGKLLVVLGKLTERYNQTSTGLALVSNDKQVLRLAMSTRDDGSLSFASLRISNPQDVREKELFIAGVSNGSEGIGLIPSLDLTDRELGFRTTIRPYGLNISVKIRELTMASAASLTVDEDHSAALSLGGAFKDFKVSAIAESDKPRLEVKKDGHTKTFGFVP